jgi:hypothetical protein
LLVGFAVPTVADAGVFSAFIKGLTKKSAPRATATTVTRSQALQAATGAAITGGAVGLLAGAGLSASPVEEERKAVEEEIQVAIKNREPTYQARVCLHPVKQEFYTVPGWTQFCGDGSKPKNGEAIDLTAYHAGNGTDGTTEATTSAQ